MAYDSYSRPPDSAGYAPSEGRKHYPPPPPPPASGPTSHHPSFSTESSTSRHSSLDRGDARMPPPPPPSTASRRVDEYVASAIEPNRHKEVDPDLVAQITESVIRQLRTTGTSDHTGAGGSSNSSSTPHAAASTFPPPPPPSGHAPSHSPAGRSSAASPSPPSASAAPAAYAAPVSPRKHAESSASKLDPHRHAPPRDRDERETSRHRSDDSDEPVTRPKGPVRLNTSEEATTLEKIWGTLFEENGQSTARLGQVLRGLAMHLVEDRDPKHSLVVTPQKMVGYYDSVRLPKEIYPWADIFDDAESSISRMYRELAAQHHLVQEPKKLEERPDVPSLTPQGFERWATLMILAHPDEEFERLRMTLADMPISNPDDRKERFPKDISRRLFPADPDLEIRDRLINAIEEHTGLEIRRVPDSSGSPARKRKGSRKAPGSEASFGGQAGEEREPNRYAASVSDEVIENEDEDEAATPMPTQPIERERKPYSVGKHGGKIYDDLDSRSNPGSASGGQPLSSSVPRSSYMPPASSSSMSGHAPLHRSNSGAGRPVNIPPPTSGPHEMHGRNARQSMSGRRPPRSHSPASSLGGAGDYRRGDIGPGSMGDGASYEEDYRRLPRESEMRRQAPDYMRGGSPSRRYQEYADRRPGPPGPSAPYADEDYYRRREPRNW